MCCFEVLGGFLVLVSWFLRWFSFSVCFRFWRVFTGLFQDLKVVLVVCFLV